MAKKRVVPSEAEFPKEPEFSHDLATGQDVHSGAKCLTNWFFYLKPDRTLLRRIHGTKAKTRVLAWISSGAWKSQSCQLKDTLSYIRSFTRIIVAHLSDVFLTPFFSSMIPNKL